MLKKVYNHLRGSVQVDVYGAAIERFLNICAIHGVSFWDVRCVDAAHFTAWVSADGYFALHPYARNTGCSVRVHQKRGVPFAAKTVTRRWALCLGLLVCAATVWFLSGFVWTIEVRGCENLSQRDVLELLDSEGLKTGARRRDVHLRELRNNVMLKTDKLSYLTVNFQGTHAVIQVWERRNQETKPEKPAPCEVVSELTGIVTAVRVRTGQARTKVGDTLQPGDLIATGVIVNENDETQVTLLHAEAEADLRTWYTLKTVVPAELQMLASDGAVQNTNSLQLGQRRFPLGIIEKNGFSWYDKQINIQYLQMQEHFRWPIVWFTGQTRRCKAENVQINREKLSDVLEQRMIQQLMAQKTGATLVQTSFSLTENDAGAWLGILEAELMETTGLEVPIG